jgi:hypothetical protein
VDQRPVGDLHPPRGPREEPTPRRPRALAQAHLSPQPTIDLGLAKRPRLAPRDLALSLERR